MKTFALRLCALLGILAAVGCGSPSADQGADTSEPTAPAGKIIISGASGGLAGETIEALLAQGVAPSDLILVTRSPEKLSELAARGATVREGDFDEPATLPAAFEGGDRMLLISTGGGDRVTQHTNAINAAKEAGVRHVAYTSWVNPVEENPAFVTNDHLLTEEALRNSGLQWTMLRNQLYANGQVARGAQAIAAGELVTNSGDGQWAPVVRADCAAAAAAVLAGEGHEGKIYDITGPELITEQDLAEMLTEISGKPVKVVSLDDEAYVSRMSQAGMPEQFARLSATFGTAVREGHVAVVSTAVQDLTGRPAQSMREFLAANKEALLAPPPQP